MRCLLVPPKKKTVPPRVYSSRLQLLAVLVGEMGIQPGSQEGRPQSKLSRNKVAPTNDVEVARPANPVDALRDSSPAVAAWGVSSSPDLDAAEYACEGAERQTTSSPTLAVPPAQPTSVRAVGGGVPAENSAEWCAMVRDLHGVLATHGVPLSQVDVRFKIEGHYDVRLRHGIAQMKL